MTIVMRSVKIWGGAMAGLLGAFAVVLLLLREVVLHDGTRVTTGSAVSVLVVFTVPLILGPALGAYIAAWLTMPAAASHVVSPASRGLAGGELSGRGNQFGEWSGMAILLGGVAVDDEAVWELARLVKQPLNRQLETALRLRTTVVGVTPEDRKTILQALDDAPDSLRGVRELLLTDESWRQSLTELQQSAAARVEWSAARSVA